jgi:hypothetical protein
MESMDGCTDIRDPSRPDIQAKNVVVARSRRKPILLCADVTVAGLSVCPVPIGRCNGTLPLPK